MLHPARITGVLAVAVGVWLAVPAIAGAGSITSAAAFGDVPLGTTAPGVSLAVSLDDGYSLASFSSTDGAFAAPWSVNASGCSPESDAACTVTVGFTASVLGAHTAHFN